MAEETLEIVPAEGIGPKKAGPSLREADKIVFPETFNLPV